MIKRYETTILKDRAVGDKTQVADTNATVTFYKQGATVSSATAWEGQGEPQALPVYNVGAFAVGDSISVNGGVILGAVTAVGTTTITATNTSGEPVVLAAGDRLMCNTAPRVFDTPIPGTPIATATSDSTGRVGFYPQEATFDYVVSSSGAVLYIVVDQKGGTEEGVVIATDFETLQDAIDAVPNTGGIVDIPAGEYIIQDTLIIDKPITLRGYVSADDHRGGHLTDRLGTTLIMDPTVINKDLLLVQSRHVTLQDLTLYGAGSGTGRGIVIQGVADVLWHIVVERVMIKQTGAEALSIPNGDPAVILTSFRNCSFKENHTGNLVYLGWAHTTLTFTDCNFFRYTGSAIYSHYTYGTTFTQCAFEEPFTDTGPAVQLISCNNFRFYGCWFENTTTNQAQWPIRLNGTCTATVVRNCNFAYGTNTGYFNPRIIYVDTQSIGTVIEDCWATIANGTLWPTNHIIIDGNSADTTIIGGGIIEEVNAILPTADITDQHYITLNVGTFADYGVEVGDVLSYLSGHIPYGATIQSITGNEAYTTATLVNGTGLTIGVDWGGRYHPFAVSDYGQFGPALINDRKTCTLLHTTPTDKALINTEREPTNHTQRVIGPIWVVGASTGQELQIYDGTRWTYLPRTPVS